MVDGSFFCQSCLESKPIGDTSPDDRYCLSCFEFLKSEEQEIVLPKDYWSGENLYFVHYEQKWGVKNNLETGYAGPVQGTVPNTPESLSDEVEVVSKLTGIGEVGVNGSQAENGGSFETTKDKHLGGRPRKQDGEPVSRVTVWRRQKEIQGALF